MDDQNGDCFEHHDALFAPLSSSDTEHDCLKDFLLDPPRHEQQTVSPGYCFDDRLQNLSANHNLMNMTMTPGLPMSMDSGLSMSSTNMHMPRSAMSLAGTGLTLTPNHGMSLPLGQPLSLANSGLPLGASMSCRVPIPPNVGMSLCSDTTMPIAGSSGLGLSQSSCLSMSTSTNLSMSNQVLQMPSSSSLSLNSNTRISPNMPSPISTGSHTMPTNTSLPMTSNHSLSSSSRTLLDRTSSLPISNIHNCINESTMMMHQAFAPNSHLSQLHSPVHNQAILQSPVQSQGALQSPLNNQMALQSPVHNQVSLQSSLQSQSMLQSPVQSQTPLQSPVQSQSSTKDFRSPGHSIEISVPCALDNGLVLSECSEKNGEWSPAETGDSTRTCGSIESVEPGTSERTVSSDCVSCETICSPETEGLVDLGNEEKKGKQETRGRKRKIKQPRQRKSPTTIATYQSQISPDQNGIKIRIKKSLTLAPQKTRKRRSKPNEESDGNEESLEQSPWGEKMPEDILKNIFYMVTKIEGCIPFLVRMSRVCRLWRDAALSPHLWYHIDLASTWCRDRVKNDRTFQWLCENRLAQVQELNLGGWSFNGIPSVLDKMAASCVKLQGLGLSGLKGLTLENIKFLISNCPYIERLDLSGINPELNSPRSAVSTASLVYLAQTMGERLTHLILANNKLAGLSQIISAISIHCPNLQVLDLANIRTVAQTTAYIHIEKLQEGCPSLRVLRLTNSQLALSPVSFNDQATSQGFPQLEELSVAGVVEGISSQPFIDDEALQRIIKSSKKLRLLDVRGCNKVSDSSLVRIPAWDLEHIFLSGCFVTRLNDSGLELIVKKWSHSLVEVDLAWSSATEPLDAAVTALAEQGSSSRLRTLDLCGSSVSLEPVRAVLSKCPLLSSINLSSCRALPRGMKRLYQGLPLVQLRSSMLNQPTENQST